MTSRDIIRFFFLYGCVDPENNELPLRNCEKIKSLYERDIREAGCCSGMHYKIHRTYERRLKEFLKREEDA